jgi:hypothetical protein
VRGLIATFLAGNFPAGHVKGNRAIGPVMETAWGEGWWAGYTVFGDVRYILAADQGGDEGGNGNRLTRAQARNQHAGSGAPPPTPQMRLNAPLDGRKEQDYAKSFHIVFIDRQSADWSP